MKTKHLILSLALAVCVIGTVVCFVFSPNHREPVEQATMDNRPPLAHTDSARECLVVLEVSGNGLSARYDNHVDPLASDVLSVKLNTSSPGYAASLEGWLHALGPERLKSLKEGNKLEIRVGRHVSEDLVKQIADVLHKAGIAGYAVKKCWIVGQE